MNGGNGKEKYGEDYADIYAINRLHFKAAMNNDCDHVSRRTDNLKWTGHGKAVVKSFWGSGGAVVGQSLRVESWWCSWGAVGVYLDGRLLTNALEERVVVNHMHARGGAIFPLSQCYRMFTLHLSNFLSTLSCVVLVASVRACTK